MRTYVPPVPFRRPGSLDAFAVPSQMEVAMGNAPRSVTITEPAKPNRTASTTTIKKPLTTRIHNDVRDWRTNPWPEAQQIMAILTMRADGQTAAQIGDKVKNFDGYRVGAVAAGAILSKMRIQGYPIKSRVVSGKTKIWMLVQEHA